MTKPYDAIEKAVSPVVKHYREDLTKHDRAQIEAMAPHTPFIHIARDCGTHLIALIPASEYPPKGEQVTYLFGTRGRDGLLASGREWLRAIEKHNPHAVVHYWDGWKLARINYAKAYDIDESYCCRIRREWAELERPATRAELDEEERRYAPTWFHSFA